MEAEAHEPGTTETEEPRALRLPGSIHLHWSEALAPNRSEIVIERLEAWLDGGEVIASLGPSETAFVHRGLNAGERYCYRIRSFSGGSVVHHVRTCAVARFEY